MSRGYAHPEYLVDTDWLAAHLEDPAVRVFDCTTILEPDPATVYHVVSGRAGYDAGHIPGAGFLDLQGELSDRSTRLRFMMPPPAQFADVVGGRGVGNDSRVILYSTASPMWATRLWLDVPRLRTRCRRGPGRRLRQVAGGGPAGLA
jgi:thiosulfate/3-mercaptopyruvate sulfurtransferase